MGGPFVKKKAGQEIRKEQKKKSGDWTTIEKTKREKRERGEKGLVSEQHNDEMAEWLLISAF